MKHVSRRRSRRGSGVLEFTLLFPMMVFLFIGTFDWGFYAYALISAENALRVAATYTSTNGTTAIDSTQACTYAIQELQGAPNMASVTTCNALPLIVTATAVTGPDGNPATQVALRYQTTKLIPIPGLLTGQATIYRVFQMRLRG
jgi:Flp pilus assembly protein TadG